MAKKEEYKQRNIDFLKEISQKEGVQRHPSGIMYQIVQQGTGRNNASQIRELVRNRLI